MREIKFRAWDKTNKRMEEIDGGNLYVADNKVYEISEESHYYEVYMSKKDVTERYILTQFTGLHDKNGTPIYEGDILSNKTGRICKVVWFEAQACFDAKPLTSKGTSALFTPNYWRHCEVTGNIYENKELIP